MHKFLNIYIFLTRLVLNSMAPAILLPQLSKQLELQDPLCLASKLAINVKYRQDMRWKQKKELRQKVSRLWTK
jgi:hypothetical protein